MASSHEQVLKTMQVAMQNSFPDGLLDVLTSYKVYLYPSLSKNPTIVTIDKLEDLTPIAGIRLVEIFLVTTRITTKGTNVSESLYGRKWLGNQT
jgi:hypothetical protein